MVSNEEVADLDISTLPIIELLVERRYLRGQSLIFGQRGETIDLQLVKVKLRVEVLWFVSESNYVRLDCKCHLLSLEFVVSLRLVAVL